MRAVALSDSSVIANVNSQFVPLMINITDQGLPREIPGLALWQKAYTGSWRYANGFATSVVLEPSGRGPLGTSGCGHTWELDTSINYDAVKYQALLNGCLERFKRYQALTRHPDRAGSLELRQDIERQLKAANRCAADQR